MRKHTFEAYRDGYAKLWDDMTVRPVRVGAVKAAAREVIAGKARYMPVQIATGVPWFMVGIIHKMECGLSWTRHLHNGDPLTGRTTRVPSGCPRTGSPPFTWEASATDALRLKSLHKIELWSVERIAYELERFNGFGYRKFGVPSPYLWSFTTAYTSGKYVRDGVWSASAVSAQSGGMALLREIAELERLHIPREGQHVSEPVDEMEQLPPTPSAWVVLRKSRTLAGSVVAAIGTAATWLADKVASAVTLLPDIATEADTFSDAVTRLAGHVGLAVAWIGAAAVLYGLAVVAYARIDANSKGKVG